MYYKELYFQTNTSPRLINSMKKINLNKNKFALVDDKNFKYLNQFKWWITKQGYAVTKINSKMILMHRLINNTSKGFETDHINRDKLDNRQSNLRSVTKQINSFNISKQKNNTSGYKGVYLIKSVNKWMAQIMVNRKSIYLGLFSNIQAAVLARKWAERRYFATS